MPYKKDSGTREQRRGPVEALKIMGVGLDTLSAEAESDQHYTAWPSGDRHEITIPSWLDNVPNIDQPPEEKINQATFVAGERPPDAKGITGRDKPQNSRQSTADGLPVRGSCGSLASKGVDLLLLHREQATWQRIEQAITQRDWRYRSLSSIQELRESLVHEAKAVLIDACFLPEISRHRLWLDYQRQRLPALLFVSERCDIGTRIQAIQAGASKLFLEPFDLNALMKTVAAYMLPKSEPEFRVLLIADMASKAMPLAELLRGGAIETLVLTEPQAVIDSIWRFLPNLILMIDPRREDIDNIVLTKLIRDREESVAIPIVFLAKADNPQAKQAALQAGADDVLTLPMPRQQLLTIIRCRIERSRAMSVAGVRKQDADQEDLPDRKAMLLRLEQLGREREEGIWFYGMIVIVLDSLPGDKSSDKVRHRDQLMATMAEGLRPMLQGKDYLARIEHNHLAILIRRSHQQAVEQLAHLALEIVNYRLGTLPAQLKGVGISLTQVTNDNHNAEELLELGELSAYADYRQREKAYHPYEETPSTQAHGVKEGVVWDKAELLYALQNDALRFRERKFVCLNNRHQVTETIELFPVVDHPNSPIDIYQQAAKCDAAAELDRFVLELAVRRLWEYTQLGKAVRLILRQSAAVLEEEDYVDSIKSILRRLQIVGSGLVLEFALPSIATRLDRSIDLFDELTALGICVSLSHFPSKKSGFKALGYLNVDIIRPRSSLLNSEAWNIEDIRRITHARNIEIILPEIDAIERISNLWWRCADYIQAEFPRQARRAPGALGEDLLTLYLGAYRSDSDSCREAAIPRE